MRYLFSALALLALAISPLMPGARANAQGLGITVDDFGTGSATFTYTDTPPLRRGVTTRVIIVKDLIDLVSFNDVSISGGGTIGALSNGRTSQGRGYLAMDVTVPSGQNPGSTITLKVGLIDQFRFKAVRRGLVSSVTANPQPSTLQPGTPWVVTFQGTDIGGAVANLAGAPCHTSVAGNNQSSTSMQFTLTRSATCATTTFSVRLGPSGGNDPATYNLAAGPVAGLTFSYLPPPPAGVACVSDPSVGAPSITAPVTGQVIVFGSGTASPTNITIRWDSLTLNQRQAPNREWIVTRNNASTIGPVIGRPTRTSSTTVTIPARTQPSVTQSFSIPGTHSVSIRAKNCGQSAPTSTVTFSTQY